ncbi:NADH-quinone oxidoreductase subunit K [Salinibacillus kushneri]|uniref:NADH-quinone oxidoreductase subunit K n=1 Tax=Salinibacillus kushneri TaxID=237682 RepID=A0A1I0CZL4_9BACI|nr:NADH-quinone oxidoreductase subunit NuoK [Salinibacillus kushneri]SET24785.1 NADH-quinone oxidoreductase subunit K [Salinibacillus kushneri]
MSTLPLQPFLILALILFCMGLFGALTKRNTIIVLVCIELMLNAVNLNLVAFSKYGAQPDITGQVFSLFSITIAAAEVAVGMAILIAWYRNKNSVNIDEVDELKD